MLRIKTLQDQLRRTQQKLAEQAITDELTGLKNRRAFDERLQEEFRRAQRYTRSGVAHHDRPGPLQAGERPLRPPVRRRGAARGGRADPRLDQRPGHLRALRRRGVRGHPSQDPPLRRALGGRADLEAARRAGVLHQLGGAPEDAQFHVTASLGIAFYPSKDITTPELLLRFADEALYQAKRAGRNTICLYQAQAYRYEARPLTLPAGAFLPGPDCLSPRPPGGAHHRSSRCRLVQGPSEPPVGRSAGATSMLGSSPGQSGHGCTMTRRWRGPGRGRSNPLERRPPGSLRTGSKDAPAGAA